MRATIFRTVSTFGTLLILLAAGCTAFQVGGNIQQGRTALMTGKPQRALGLFQSAAALNPDYALNFSPLSQGVWTYVGRAYYVQGKLAEAQKALEQARTRHPDDNMAKLYLGLVLARDADRQRGLRELDAGLTGLRDWLDDMEQYDSDARFWDSTGELRSEIQKQLAMISTKEVNLPELVSRAEWLGTAIEEEIDLAEKLKRREESNDSDNDMPE